MLMRNVGINHYALFWTENNGLQSAYFVNNGPQSVFWISYKFHKTILSVVLGGKQGVMLKLVNSKHEDSLSLNFLVYFVEMSSYFSMKTSKRKVRKRLK